MSRLTGFALASGQTLKSSGTIVGDLSVGAGSILSPGNSPGIVTHAGNQALDRWRNAVVGNQ